MHPATTVDPLLTVFCEAISARGWCTAEDLSQAANHDRFAEGKCVLCTLLNLDREDEPNLKLSAQARGLLQQLCGKGVSLYLGWPRLQSEAVDEWLGRRFYFSASTNFSSKERFVSLVSSQLGRHGSKIPNWPTLVDAALRNARRDRERPLILAGTSLSEATEQFSNRAGLDSLKIQHDDRVTTEDWLSNLLDELELAHAAGSLESLVKESFVVLRLSPPEKQSSAPEIASRPLQDRLAFALADRVIAIHIRRNGTIADLAERRIVDSRFPAGSVFIASTFGKQAERELDLDEWLDRGAVGWLLEQPSQRPDGILARCKEFYQPPFTQSLCFPIPNNWLGLAGECSGWPFLAHCTRGNLGPLPNESLEQFHDRAWCAGAIPNSHPLLTLQQILNDDRIKGNTRLTRSQAVCVSFSEVPLAELLSRRQFRSHLGRWDWEPYGILVRRDALERLGARPVVYGDEADYKQLADNDKPYFQPRGKKDSRSDQDWTSEREWRFLGDLNFAQLPRDSILVFVATRAEAQQMASRFQWPVVWSGSR